VSRPDSRLATGCDSEAEWELRMQLAACYRAFVHYGWTDLIFTHLSARSPDNPRHYLINPYGLLFHEIRAGNLIKVDFDGNVVAGDYPYNEAGHAIHSAVLQARPDVNVALHSHTRAGMAVSCMQCGLLPLTQQANEVRDLLCYHEYGIAVSGSEECARLGADLGDKSIMIMQNHGLLTVGRSVAEAFYYLYTIENACKVQVDVMAYGGEIVTPAPEIVDQLAAYGKNRAAGSADHVEMAWSAVLRLLEEKDPSYRS
jgi:ribulose-5-phosphate 4-epimerase/fuculose-1-phosphate aldolase